MGSAKDIGFSEKKPITYFEHVVVSVSTMFHPPSCCVSVQMLSQSCDFSCVSMRAVCAFTTTGGSRSPFHNRDHRKTCLSRIIVRSSRNDATKDCNTIIAFEGNSHPCISLRYLLLIPLDPCEVMYGSRYVICIGDCHCSRRASNLQSHP